MAYPTPTYDSITVNESVQSQSIQTTLNGWTGQPGTTWQSQYHANWNVVQSEIPYNPTEWQVYTNAANGIGQTQSGTGNITYQSGSVFDSAWVGLPYFYFNGVQYKVSAVSGTTLTVQTVAGAAVSFPATAAGTFYFCSTSTTSVVNVAGTAVTYVSGQPFVSLFQQVFINGTAYTATYNSPTSLTLSTSAGTLTNATLNQYDNINNELATLRVQGLNGSAEENFAIAHRPDGTYLESQYAGAGQYRPIFIATGENPAGTVSPMVSLYPNATLGQPGTLALGGTSSNAAVRILQNNGNANYLLLQGAAPGVAPSITVAGADSSQNLNLIPKGSGVVNAAGGLVTEGNITAFNDFGSLFMRSANNANLNAWRATWGMNGASTDGPLTLQHSTDDFGANFTNALTLAANGNVTAGGVLDGQYKSAATGSVSRLLSAKVGDVTALADFGLTGSSVTINASAYAAANLVIPAGVTATLNVPSVATTLNAAITAIATWQVRGTLIIQVADGTYTLSTSLYLNHPNGSNIHLIGDVTNPANCVIQSSGDGAYVPYGFEWGEINGFTFNKTGGSSNVGIYTDGGKLLKVGPNLSVNGFYYGIAARNGGLVNASGTASAGVKVTGAGDVGIWAFLNSYVTCEYATVTGSKDATNNLGGGIVAEFASSIDATNATCTGNWLVGISSISGSSIRAWNTTVSGNGGASGICSGYNIASMGAMEIFSGTTSSNTGYGYATDGSCQFSGNYSLTSNTGNTLGLYYMPLQVKPDGTVAFERGSVTIDATQTTATGGATYFDQNIPTTNFSIQRFLTAGTEVWRQQFRNDSNKMQWSAGSVTGLTYHPLVGAMSVGAANPATSATDGFFAIPKMAGAPTGTPTLDSGYAPMVFDSPNSKIWIYNGTAWKSVVLS